MDKVTSVFLIGIGATLATDVWAVLRRRLFGIPSGNFGLLGRWFGHMARGRFRHEAIAAAAPVRGERAIGWIAHYAIGIAFAALLVALYGAGWVREPTLAPALIVGVGTVAVPFLTAQPGMGLGFAASRAPRPWFARLQSLLTHTVFGLGLYLSALALRWAATQ